MDTFYSQSSNFVSAATSGVDPRTGLFSATIPLGKLVGNSEFGPTLDLTLSYTPLSTDNCGLGVGCSVALSQYDATTGTLSLSNGERYKVLETSKGAILQQHKLKNLLFEKAENAYKIVYPSGQIEILTGPDNAYDIKVPVELYSPLGHRLTLSWDFTAGRQPRLVSVSDEENTLLQITYSSGGAATLAFWPGQTEAYSVRLYFLNGYLTRIENDAADPPLVWILNHVEVGQRWMLGSIKDPVGLTDEVEYQEEGHAFPQTAHMPPLPYVISRTLRPGGGQPAMEASYSYTEHNYLGGSTGQSWNSDEDYLYGLLTDYEYGSTETVGSGDTVRSTARTYNAFHLLTKEETAQGECRQTTTTVYYAVVGEPFENQVPQFQSPKTVTVVYQDGDRIGEAETTKTEFDDSGNLVRLKKPDGSVTQYVYYPAEGEGEDCPADPNGFVHLLKSETSKPATAHYQDAPDQTRQLKYLSLPAVAGGVVASALLTDTEDVFSGDLRIATKKYAYVNDIAQPRYGGLNRITTTLYGEGDSPPTYVSTVDLAFSLKADALTQTTTVTGHDALATVQSETRSRFSGRIWSTTDDQENNTVFESDGLGRIVAQTVNPGSDYERKAVWTYTRDVKSGSSVQVVDAAGNGIMTVFDALGREIQRKKLARDGSSQSWALVEQSKYDTLGRLVSTTAYDYFRDIGDGAKKISNTTKLRYDSWSQRSSILYGDGREEVSLYDPVSRVCKNQLKGGDQALGVVEVHYNAQGLVSKQIRYDSANIRQGETTQLYDGLGRVRSIKDALGQTTRYDYDPWGRVIKTTLPDDTTVTKKYAPHSTEGLITDIAVNGKSLGTQEFDSLGRLSKSTTGGRTFTLSYDGALPKPAKVTTPAAQAITYGYITKLDDVVEKITAANIARTFSYDAKSALVKSATVDGGMATTLAYYPSGLLKEERFASGSDSKVAKYSWSQEGLIQSYDDVSGTAAQWRYDKYGRVAEVADKDMKVTPKLDGLGRLTGWTATDLSTNGTMKTALVFDDLNREIKRTIKDGNSTLTVSQEYRLNDQLSRRVTTRSGATLRDEKFSYDERNRLVGYECTGDALPKCEYGRRIRARTFTYDALGNIKKVITTFKDNSTDTGTYHYKNDKDPMRLTEVRHTDSAYPSTISLTYNKLGCLTTDEANRALVYDALGRLTGATPPKGPDAAESATYRYDAFSKLVGQSVGETDVQMYYRADELVNEVQGEGSKRYLRIGEQVAAQRSEAAGGGGTRLIGADMAASMLQATNGKSRDSRAYTPYGYSQPDEQDEVGLGYNGERSDPLTGVSHLGNGYRAYNPVLMRFNAPDSMSPFGEGGVNPYAYCAGDPINAGDPSGHLSTEAWMNIGFGLLALAAVALTVFTAGASLGVLAGIGVALGTVSGVSGILSGALEEAAPGASNVLNWVSIVTGLVSIGAEIPALIKSIRAAGGVVAKIGTGARGLFGSSRVAPALPEGGIALGKSFVLYKSGKVTNASRAVLTSHGMQFFGKSRAPTQLRFFGPEGHILNGAQLVNHAINRLKVVEPVAAGSWVRKYSLWQFSADNESILRIAANSDVDIIAVRPRFWDAMKSLTTTSDLFDALKTAGINYETIDLSFCRGRFFRSLATNLISNSFEPPVFKAIFV